MGRGRQKLRWWWVLFSLAIGLAVYVVSQQTIRTYSSTLSSAFSLAVATLATAAALAVLMVVALFRRRCPGCGKLRLRLVRSAWGRGEVLACRACGYEDARGWAYRTGGSAR